MLTSHAATVRSNQRDLFQVSALREEAENVLRAWLGELSVCGCMIRPAERRYIRDAVAHSLG